MNLFFSNFPIPFTSNLMKMVILGWNNSCRIRKVSKTSFHNTWHNGMQQDCARNKFISYDIRKHSNLLKLERMLATPKRGNSKSSTFFLLFLTEKSKSRRNKQICSLSQFPDQFIIPTPRFLFTY